MAFIRSAFENGLVTRLLTIGLLIMVLSCVGLQVHAEDQTQPTIDAMIGGFLFSSDHSYVAESRVILPILRLEPLTLSYRHYQITPVLKQGSQTQLLYSRNELEADWTLGEHLRLITIGGYRNTSFEDRAGSLGAYALGGGLGSPLRRELPRLEWSAVAGGYLARSTRSARFLKCFPPTATVRASQPGGAPTTAIHSWKPGNPHCWWACR